MAKNTYSSRPSVMVWYIDKYPINVSEEHRFHHFLLTIKTSAKELFQFSSVLKQKILFRFYFFIFFEKKIWTFVLCADFFQFFLCFCATRLFMLSLYTFPISFFYFVFTLFINFIQFKIHFLYFPLLTQLYCYFVNCMCAFLLLVCWRCCWFFLFLFFGIFLFLGIYLWITIWQPNFYTTMYTFTIHFNCIYKSSQLNLYFFLFHRLYIYIYTYIYFKKRRFFDVRLRFFLLLVASFYFNFIYTFIKTFSLFFYIVNFVSKHSKNKKKLSLFFI